MRDKRKLAFLRESDEWMVWEFFALCIWKLIHFSNLSWTWHYVISHYNARQLCIQRRAESERQTSFDQSEWISLFRMGLLCVIKQRTFKGIETESWNALHNGQVFIKKSFLASPFLSLSLSRWTCKIHLKCQQDNAHSSITFEGRGPQGASKEEIIESYHMMGKYRKVH